jgi:hypothetical protein
MANVQITKTVFKKDDFNKAVDTEFSTFVEPEVEVDNDTVEELFRLYNKLYFEIPTDSDVNSHKYLIQESSKLVEFTSDLEDIQPLLDEIAQLRQQLLIANQEIIEVQTEAIENAAN